MKPQYRCFLPFLPWQEQISTCADFSAFVLEKETKSRCLDGSQVRTDSQIRRFADYSNLRICETCESANLRICGSAMLICVAANLRHRVSGRVPYVWMHMCL